VSGGLIDRLRRIVAREGHGEPSGIRLVVGLGNPGKEYAANRHNVGFWTINRLARRHGIELDTRGQASVGRGEVAGRQVALAKPRTFVNESGRAVWNLIKQLELDDASELLVVYDDIDLPVGKVRLRAQGGSGGYRGLKSIIGATGSDRFARVRIGIGRPIVQGKPSYDPDAVAAYVLSDPPPEERDQLDQAVDRAIEAIEVAIADGIEAAMQQNN
jgi:PTH1 family peptidyl-tRNA hydrolase